MSDVAKDSDAMMHRFGVECRDCEFGFSTELYAQRDYEANQHEEENPDHEIVLDGRSPNTSVREDQPELVADGGKSATGDQHIDPLADLDGEMEVEVECAADEDTIPACEGWSDTIELDAPANYVNGRIELPGFGWECHECGNPHEFRIEGMWVTNLA